MFDAILARKPLVQYRNHLEGRVLCLDPGYWPV